MSILNDIIYNEQYEDCRLDLYLPPSKGFDTVVYFHGGGLTGGHKNDYYYVEIAERFAEKGMGFASVEYRKYPTAKYPDFLEDCARATAFIQKKIGEYGGNGKIYISGQSAGAWISLMLCLNGNFFKEAGVDTSAVQGYIIDSAQATSHFTVIQEEEEGVDDLAQRIDKFAPLYYVNKQTAFPKMFLIFYENDIPCRPEQNMLLYKTLLAYNPQANVEYLQLPGGHVAGSTKKDDDGEYAFVKEVFEWLKRQENR